MFFYLGVNEIGRVERCGSAWVGTDFVVFNFLPLVPLRSWVHGGDGTRRPIPLNGVSILAAYTRAYGLAAAALAVWLGRHSALALVLAGAAMVVALVAFVALGRLSRDERARRFMTAEIVGAPVALRHVAEELLPLRAELEQRVTSAVAELGAAGYRDGTQDAALVLEDREALRDAFTLARIDETSLDPNVRSRARRRSDALWARMMELGHVAQRELTRPSSAPSSTSAL